MPFSRILLGLLCVLLPLSHARAHQVPSVELEFQENSGHWRLLGEMDIAYMMPETRNIPGGPPMSRAAAMLASPDDYARFRKETENTLRKLLRFTLAGKEIGWKVEFPDFEKDPFELPPEAGDIALISVRILLDQTPGGGELRIHWAGEQETELIILIEEGDDPKIMSTLPGGDVLLLNRALSPDAPPPAKQPVAGGFLRLGFHHVLGIDHILFILGLFLLAPTWRALTAQSLLFTIAHSITLALAIFGIVHFSGKIVECLIALSIAWVGVENLFLKRLGKQRLILVFAFGLLHGLGFASVLAQKLDNVPRSSLAAPLLGFNIGVEIAQITILAAAFLFLLPIKRWQLQVQTGGSAFIAVAGIGWLIQLVFFPGSPLL